MWWSYFIHILRLSLALNASDICFRTIRQKLTNSQKRIFVQTIRLWSHCSENVIIRWLDLFGLIKNDVCLTLDRFLHYLNIVIRLKMPLTIDICRLTIFVYIPFTMFVTVNHFMQMPNRRNCHRKIVKSWIE